ncbi:tetrapyrrole methylase [Tuber brumale]|nr:tetrapyrrole methylase [Tuber brumale]
MPGLTTSAGLLTSFDCSGQVHLIVGSNPLAGARCAKSLEVGAKVKLIAPDSEALHYGLRQRIETGEVQWVRRDFRSEDLTTLGREEVDQVVDLVFVTLSVECAQCTYISNQCRRLRIPVNVADAPHLCSFTLLSTYSDGPLQIGVTTSGNGCKLSNRIKREITNTLPQGMGTACTRLGKLRRRLWEEDHGETDIFDEDVDGTDQKSNFNALVLPEDADASKTRRTRWLSQICEYWPLEKLAGLTDDDIGPILESYINADNSRDIPQPLGSLRHKGRVQLVGSGPGHPDLLTTASVNAISSADLVLADKLVPQPVLALVPRRAVVHIARKFPGNADKAQEEFLKLGLEGLQKGLNVVRLKQGDPYIYGRGAEEFEFFESHGYTPTVLPGITSSLSAPLFACIPPTHRGVADQALICTGTGRKGTAPEMPEYVSTRTTVFLMALHRLGDMVRDLEKKGWPMELPCAVIERASCSDQRIVRSTLENVCFAVEEVGSRPPGLIVVGWACEVVKKLDGKKWIVEEKGFRL